MFCMFSECSFIVSSWSEMWVVSGTGLKPGWTKWQLRLWVRWADTRRSWGLCAQISAHCLNPYWETAFQHHQCLAKLYFLGKEPQWIPTCYNKLFSYKNETYAHCSSQFPYSHLISAICSTLSWYLSISCSLMWVCKPYLEEMCFITILKIEAKSKSGILLPYRKNRCLM